jgi:preprotein translocase subunit SecA
MFGKLMKKVFGTKHERQMKKLQPLVNHIGSLEPGLQKLDDAQLKAKTAEFRERLGRGESLEELLPEVFATVREASVRALGMRHYDVQMLGGVAMHRGMILEMRTGEGKTLTATSALFLNALGGRGAHLITVNDYLASRDAEWMGQIYNFLGMSVGSIVHGLWHHERQQSYRADITYGTNNEFGFDYLRDNMKETIEKYVQRELNYAIVDEVDSILIDEARTPLIISGESAKPADTYVTVDRMIPSLRKDLDYLIDEKGRSAQLTDAGVDRVERLLNCKNLYAESNSELLHHVNQGLRGHALYKKDVNYLVTNDEIVIVDEFTGRKMEGRRWSDGLHQAIEAKEGVTIKPESQTLATITYQNYFRMYDKLAGMTGTAQTEAGEFHSIYGLDVIVIPTNKPLIRDDQDDLVFKNERGKFKAVIEEIREAHTKGQPVLVGTTSVDKSQVVHNLLDRAGIPHNTLNAKNHGREAFIVAQAGQKGAVTVATNMAGRGTDIILGGNADMMARQHFDPDKEPDKFNPLFEGLKAQCDAEKAEVLALGGLKIIGTERHESRRIDNQLRGRAGRQGDPGASRFFLSLDGDLMRIFGADRITGLMERLGMEEDVPIEAGMVNRAIANAQQKVEAMHFDTRKNLFEYDNVMNEQRKAIYALRKQILEGRYVPEILDDEARKEALAKGRDTAAEAPKTSGTHTLESMRDDVKDRVMGIIHAHCCAIIESRKRIPPEGVIAPWPKGGIAPRKLTHEVYSHFGAVAPLEPIAEDKDAVIECVLDTVANSLIQQRERIHDLAYDLLTRLVVEMCPENVHPDEWGLEELEKSILERFYCKVDLSKVVDDVDKLIDMCWEAVEASLVQKEKDADGLYNFLFFVRMNYLKQIDERWVAHLKNIEHLRTGIGLVGYATRDPKNEYKLRGYNLFSDMWDNLEYAVLDQTLQMQLSEEDKRRAAEGAEHETTLTKHSRRREGGTAAARETGQLDKLQAAARHAVAQLQAGGIQGGGGASVPGAAQAKQAAQSAPAAAKPAAKKYPKVGKNDPCPCGSGKRFKKCHGKPAAATV